MAGIASAPLESCVILFDLSWDRRCRQKQGCVIASHGCPKRTLLLLALLSTFSFCNSCLTVKFVLDVHLYINQNLGSVRGLASLTTKTISISEELYRLLEKMRLPGERFDDTILRLCGVKARGKDFEASFGKVLNEVVSEDADLLERLAH